MAAMDNQQNKSESKKSGQHIRFVEELPECLDTNENDQPSCENEHNVSNKDYLIAALLMKNAQKGRVVDFKLDERSLKYYRLYYNKWYVRCATLVQIIFLFGLFFCEWPLNRKFHEESQGVSTSRKIGLVLEIVCILFLFKRFYIHYTFEKWDTFKRDPKNYVLFISMVGTILSLIAYWVIILSNNGKLGSHLNIHYAAFLRPLIVINSLEKRQVRRVLRNIRRTVLKIIPILLLIVLSVLMFALLCYKLYYDNKLKFPDGEPYFQHMLESFWELWILTTTSNSPDVMLPAYLNQRYYCVIYVIFFITTVMLLFPIMLAITMDDYKKNLKDEVKRAVIVRRNLLNQAFDLIATPIENFRSTKTASPESSSAKDSVDHRVDGQNEDQINSTTFEDDKDKDDCKVLSKLGWLTLLRFLDPELSRAKGELLFCVLEGGYCNHIQRSDFLRSADLLNVRLSEVKDRLNFFDINFWFVYDSKPSLYLRAFVKSKAFSLFFSLVIVANTIYIFFTDDTYDWIFLMLYMIEIMLKIYTKGFLRYFQQLENLFDCGIIFGAAILYIATHVSSQTNQERLQPLVEVLMIFRILRLVKGFRYLSRRNICPSFTVILQTIISVMPSFFMYGSVLMLIYYEFALLGIHLFRDRFYFPENLDISVNQTDCGNRALQGTEFAKLYYCRHNFNNGVQSLVTLFSLMVVNQWHVITEGHVKVTNIYARLYFVIFEITCMVLLNIFLAFVVEVFILEYHLSRTKHESAIETKIKEMGLAYNKDKGSGSSFLPAFFWHSSTGDISNTNRSNPENDLTEIEPGMEMDFDQKDMDMESSVTTKRPRSFTANVEGVKFHLKKRGGKSIELLLQSLFGDQIELSDPIFPKSQNIDLMRLESNNSSKEAFFSETFLKTKRRLSKIFST